MPEQTKQFRLIVFAGDNGSAQGYKIFNVGMKGSTAITFELELKAGDKAFEAWFEL